MAVLRDKNGKVLPGSVLNPLGPGASGYATRKLYQDTFYGSSTPGRVRKLFEILWTRALSNIIDYEAIKILLARGIPAPTYSEIKVSGDAHGGIQINFVPKGSKEDTKPDADDPNAGTPHFPESPSPIPESETPKDPV